MITVIAIIRMTILRNLIINYKYPLVENLFWELMLSADKTGSGTSAAESGGETHT